MGVSSLIRRKFDSLSKLNDLFNRREKLQFLGVITVVTVSALFGALGVASVFPFVNLVMDPEAVANSQLLQQVFDFFGFSSTNSFSIFVGFMVLGIIVVGQFTSAFATWLTLRFAWKNNHRLATALLKKYLSLPYVYFLNQNSAILSKNILAETQHLTKGFLIPVLRIITGVAVTIALIAILFLVNPAVTFLAFIILAMSYLIIFSIFSQKLKSQGKNRVIANKGRFKTTSEALRGIKDIKILGREDLFLQRFSKHSKRYFSIQSWGEVIGQIPRSIVEVFAFGGVIGFILFLLSSGEDARQALPLVSIFAFAGYRLVPALQGIFNAAVSFQFNKSSLDKVHEDLTEGGLQMRKISLSKKLPRPLPFKRDIKLENLSFSYPESDTSVVKNISLEIKRNTSVAIVGHTGCGKTTLVDIILGLLPPSRGAIKVDGVEINDKNTKKWQRNLGYVPQQIFLSNDTVTRNIAFGLPDEKINMAQVKRAAKIANIREFIEKELLNGYDTVIGERGINLSGGQRQRIGIARSLYTNPEVLVFDEATSALDSVTEKSVIEAIEHISKLKTMIIIAHRITTVKSSDVIYVMDMGKIVAKGTYEELMESNSQFRELAREVKKQ